MKKIDKILLIIIFNLIIIISEIGFGLISNSFALIADALHNMGDIIAIVITYIALKVSTYKQSFKLTFGFLRAEMMAGFVNTLFLFITMFYMIYEAISRFLNPEMVEPIYMISVGFIAMIANGISAYILFKMQVSSCPNHSHHHHHHHHEGDVNIKSAYLHMLSDALISIGVVIAGIFIYFFKIYYLDAILTILFSLYILHHSYPLLKESFSSLMDINIVNIPQKELENIILTDKTILEYHDLHIYKPSSKHKFISFHIVLKEKNINLEEIEKITDTIKAKLEHIGFNHILIQVDSTNHIKNDIGCTL